MPIGKQEKNKIIKLLVACLKGEPEVTKIIIFGSFLVVDSPNDIDVAVLQNSNEKYLSLAMKYRKKIRSISKELPVDIIPVCSGVLKGVMGDQISQGKVIFER